MYYQVQKKPGHWQLVRRAEPAPVLNSPRVRRSLERGKRARGATERAIEDQFIEQHGTSYSPLSKFKKHHGALTLQESSSHTGTHRSYSPLSKFKKHHSHYRSRAAMLGHIGGRRFRMEERSSSNGANRPCGKQIDPCRIRERKAR